MSLSLTDILRLKLKKKHGKPSSTIIQENAIKKECIDPFDSLNNDILPHICRVCRNPGDISITAKFGDTAIIQAMQTVTDIAIFEGDPYPQHVCKECLKELQIAFEFKKKCVNSHTIFKEALSIRNLKNPQMLQNDFLVPIQQVKKTVTTVKVKEENRSHECVSASSDSSHINDSDVNDSGKTNHYTETKDHLKINRLKAKLCVPQNKSITKGSHNPKSNGHIMKEVKSKIKEICLRYDLEFNKKEELKRPSKESLRCNYCDAAFKTKRDLNNHQREHNNTYRACPQCGKHVLHLASHERLVHSRTHKYTCHTCGKVYYSSTSLSHHIKTHRERPEFWCDHCPYRARRKSYLVDHIRAHTGDARYLCATCPKTFTDASNFRKHTLTHSNKRYECDKCNKLFRRECFLKEHYDSIHLHIKYRCSLCSKYFSSRRKLMSHEIHIHKREKHKPFGEAQKVVTINETKKEDE